MKLTSRKYLRTGAAILGMALMATACGGRGDTTSAAADGDASPAAEGAASPDDDGEVTAASASAGISDDEVRIGTSGVLSGGASSYSVVPNAAKAYFEYVNSQGGVEMGDGVTREITYKIMDDGYDPSRTSANVRELVEEWDAFTVFQVLGTSPNLAVYDYLNERGVPLVFSYVGSPSLDNPETHPWNMNGIQSYEFEAKALTEYITSKVDEPKVAFLYQDDGFGEVIREAYRDAFEGKDIEVVAEEGYDITATNLDSQASNIANSEANVLVNYSTGNFTTMAIRKLYELGWEPEAHVANSASVSIDGIFAPAGLKAAEGIAAVFAIKDPSDPKWDGDEDVQQYREIIGEYGDGLNADNILVAQGYVFGQMLVESLRGTQEPTREAFMESVNSLDAELGMMLPGVHVNTQPGYPFALTQVQVQEFNGETFEPVGDVIKLEDVTGESASESDS